MKRFISLLILSVGLLAAVACTSAAEATPSPTAISTPTSTAAETTPTPTVTPTPTATPTLSPSREWNLEAIKVDGSTVTVSVYVFAGIDVRATLDGRNPDQVNALIPILEFVFLNVTPGQHTVEVRDVVGFNEAAEVVVPTPGIPEWLTSLIQKQEHEPVANPPASITRYEYKGQTVYFLPQRCCDIFSVLYDADGTVIGHPDGGITGQGDGRVPDFFQERKAGRLIWNDQRTSTSDMVQVAAPIESVEVLIMESFPPQYSVVVVSGLPNSCITFGGYTLTRDGNTIRVEVINWKPANPDVLCAQVYGIVETTILLGSDFEPGKIYTVDVNGKTKSFKGQ